MERIKCLGRYQKAILFITFLMPLVFGVVYSMTIAKKGFAYMDTILVPEQENEKTVYTGSIQDELVSFTVDEDKTVYFQYGDQAYGPYAFKEDPTALPKDMGMLEDAVGVELFQGDQLLFRGGIIKHQEFPWLYNEDGSLGMMGYSLMESEGILTDENGRVIDTLEPSPAALLELMTGPELTHKGDWSIWFLGLFVCLINILTILFADELFRFNLSFQIQNADKAEPSEWEIAGRYIGWTGLAILALMSFIYGLK